MTWDWQPFFSKPIQLIVSQVIFAIPKPVVRNSLLRPIASNLTSEVDVGTEEGNLTGNGAYLSSSAG